MKYQLIGGGFLLAVGAIGSAVNSNDRATNYVEVSADIMTIERDCYFEQGDTRYAPKDGADISCLDMIALKKSDPEFGAMALKGNAKVKVSYTSPADQSSQTGTVELDHNDPGFETVTAYDDLKILAHKTKPAKIQGI